MEDTVPGQGLPEYDYRLYDRIWQRVSPELDPYPEVRAAAAAEQAARLAPVPVQAPPPGPGRPHGGPQPNFCCMGAAAGEDLAALEGLMEEELAERQCCLDLARRTGDPAAARLMRRFAGEKRSAARRLGTAYFLITGSCYAPGAAAEPRRCRRLADALRFCYHQEACGGFRYRRAAERTEDVCLQRLLTELGRQALRRADAVMELLEKILR